jgi:hypothetical protein
MWRHHVCERLGLHADRAGSWLATVLLMLAPSSGEGERCGWIRKAALFFTEKQVGRLLFCLTDHIQG